jgi:hypothetical protein
VRFYVKRLVDLRCVLPPALVETAKRQASEAGKDAPDPSFELEVDAEDGGEEKRRLRSSAGWLRRPLPCAAKRRTGAEIMALVREARRLARSAGRPLAVEDFRTVLLQPSADPADDWRTCAHEAGHAVVALALGYGRLHHCLVGARTGISDRTLIDTGVIELPGRQHLMCIGRTVRCADDRRGGGRLPGLPERSPELRSETHEHSGFLSRIPNSLNGDRLARTMRRNIRMST